MSDRSLSAQSDEEMLDPPSQFVASALNSAQRVDEEDADDADVELEMETAHVPYSHRHLHNRRSEDLEHEGDEVAASEMPTPAPAAQARAPAPLTPASPSSSAGLASDAASVIADSDEEDYIRVSVMRGYVFSWKLEVLYWLVAACTGGLSCLGSFWFPKVAARWRFQEESDLLRAEYMEVETMDGAGWEFLPVERVGPNPLAYQSRALGVLWLGPRHLNDPSGHPSSYVPPEDRMVLFRHHRFVLDPRAHPPAFVKQREPLQETAGVLANLLDRGLDARSHAARQKSFGLNQLTIVVPSYPTLLMREIFHPFFIFQIYSVILWCFEAYYIFALCIAVIASVSIVTTLLETRGRLAALSALARFDVELTVLRNDGPGTPSRLMRISSEQLVAGDVVEVTVGLLPCDLALLSGGAVVNEAMLTGEAIPVIKTPLHMPLDPLHPPGRDTLVALGIEARSTLYAATKILQLKPADGKSQGKVWGLVVRTGFATTKGALILSILYPRPSSFGFINQSYKFIGALFCMALVGFAVSIWQLNLHDAPLKTMVIRGLDLITIVVPPSLPLALTVGTNFALLALKKHKIFCISPGRINLAGKIQFMCFDKTGTLTSEGMELMGVLAALGGIFAPFYTTTSSTDQQQQPTEAEPNLAQDALELNERGGTRSGSPRAGEWGRNNNNGDESAERLHNGGDSPLISAGRSSSSSSSSSLALSPAMLTAMSCCHSIASLDGELIGDPLEIEIFNSTKARLHDASRDGFVCFITCPMPSASASSSSSSFSSSSSSAAAMQPEVAEWGVLTQFEFVPALQRMSVIVANQSSSSAGPGVGEVRVLVKGSPEAMRPLCRAGSIPPNYDRMLVQYAHRGYRIIAVGHKVIEGGRAGLPRLDKEPLRAWAEADLTFLGLLVLENKVKPETAPTLAQLRRALVRSVIVSGDNPITCLAVAKECGIVEQGVRVFVSSVHRDVHTGKLSVEWTDTDENVAAAAGAAGSASSSSSSLPASPAGPLKLNPRTLRFDGARGLGLQHFKYELALTGAAFKVLEEAHLDAEAYALRRAGRGGGRGGGPSNGGAGAAMAGGDKNANMDRMYVRDEIEAIIMPRRGSISGGGGDEEHGSGAPVESATRFFHRVILSTLVFARMTPDDKASLVSHLQSMGLYTGMCGDGANDTGALKAAHVGVSLSDSEASIAAPFTYQRPNISCIPVLLCEGRSSLMTSFQLFKYMAMYSMIQFTSIIMLYFKGSVFGNWEYLLQDMFIVFPLTVFMGSTFSTPHLSKKRPSGNLLSLTNVANVLAHMIICGIFQFIVFDWAQSQTDYIAYDNRGGSGVCTENGPCTYESTSVYYYSNFQFIYMAVLFAQGAPWKASIVTNVKFSVWTIVCVGVSMALLFSTHQGSFFRSEEVPVAMEWRGYMFLLLLLNIACNAAFAVFVFPRLVQWYKSWRVGRWRKTMVYGRLKPIDGPNTKRYYRLRGEFEANWERSG